MNGEPFVIKAAELHYARIPEAYWEHRIKMCKALGMNTICLYVFWNFHEQQEGKFDFSQEKNVAKFCRIAQENGMYIILRPGPYACAEWEMGGLPWWLLKKKDMVQVENEFGGYGVDKEFKKLFEVRPDIHYSYTLIDTEMVRRRCGFDKYQ